MGRLGITAQQGVVIASQSAQSILSAPGSSAGQQVVMAAPQIAAAMASVGAAGQTVNANDLAVADFTTGSLIADFSVPVVNAANALAGTLETEKKKTADDLTAAIDAAWADAAKF